MKRFLGGAMGFPENLKVCVRVADDVTVAQVLAIR